MGNVLLHLFVLLLWIIFCVGVMYMNWMYMQGEGKGIEGVAHTAPWPRSRLINLFSFHLFYMVGWAQGINFIVARRISTELLFDEIWFAVLFILMGVTDLCIAGRLFGEQRDGKVLSFIDKHGKLFVRILGVFLILFGLFLSLPAFLN